MQEYQITFGYKAVITVNVKAESEAEAREKGLKKFESVRVAVSKKASLEDDSYKVDGVLNMDETWNAL